MSKKTDQGIGILEILMPSLPTTGIYQPSLIPPFTSLNKRRE